MSSYSYQKDSVYLPKGASAEKKDLSAQNLVMPETRTEPSSFSQIRSFLCSWQDSVMRGKVEISEALQSAVEKVKSFPEDSVAFVVGVGQISKLAIKEFNEVLDESVEAVEKKGFVIAVRDGANVIFIKAIKAFRPVLEKVREVAESCSRAILGEDLHLKFSNFLSQYVGAFVNYVVKSMSGEEKRKNVERGLREVENENGQGLLGLTAGNKSGEKQVKEDLLGELVDRTSHFLKNSKDYFSHNILDDSKESSGLTPEVLVQADVRERPVFDPLPPEWVEREKDRRIVKV